MCPSPPLRLSACLLDIYVLKLCIYPVFLRNVELAFSECSVTVFSLSVNTVESSLSPDTLVPLVPFEERLADMEAKPIKQNAAYEEMQSKYATETGLRLRLERDLTVRS